MVRGFGAQLADMDAFLAGAMCHEVEDDQNHGDPDSVDYHGDTEDRELEEGSRMIVKKKKTE